MKRFTIALLAALVAGAGWLAAQGQGDRVAKPAQLGEAAWLQQFVGEWDFEFEATTGPNMPPIKGKGTQTGRAFGGTWVLSEGAMTGPMGKMTTLLTVGYDAAKDEYVGAWISSMDAQLWTYEGALDDAGKALTLEAEGPNPMAAGKLAKFRDVYEFKDKDHILNTSAMQGDDGTWHTFATAHFTRRAK